MYFKIGDIICADGEQYRVTGYIVYQNQTDHCNWEEYCIVNTATNATRWLSVDETYDEYSIWEVVRTDPGQMGYHQSDTGVEVVVSHAGGMDVDTGESARFVEYEDETEELLLSYEYWSDGREISTGYYLDKDEFFLVRHDNGYQVKKNLPAILLIAVFALVPFLSVIADLLGNIHVTSTVRKYVDKTAAYTYVTSITGGEKQKARVYSTEYSLDMATKDIIAGIEGDTEYVQQDDTETDGAIGILTPKEYCLIYTSVDGDTYVQVSSRKYAYTTDSEPYHISSEGSRFYRRFYRYTGYNSDSVTYSKYSSPYSSYDGDSFTYSSGNSYDSYSNSIRQSSIASRQSSGGGLSSGK